MRLTLTLLLLTLGPAFAEGDPEAPTRNFWGLVLFWAGAVVVMALVGRVVFREQLNERRTIRALVDRIGPFFPEFDTGAITKWVHRAAPHIWTGWNNASMATITDYATAGFLAESDARFVSLAAAGHTHHAKVEKVLKVHPLGLYMVGEGPPPADVELMLRMEFRAVDYLENADGALVSGKREARQVQYFWVLRHDGERWRLHHVEPALKDMTDLGKRPPVPPIMAWRRPKAEGEQT